MNFLHANGIALLGKLQLVGFKALPKKQELSTKILLAANFAQTICICHTCHMQSSN